MLRASAARSQSHPSLLTSDDRRSIVFAVILASTIQPVYFAMLTRAEALRSSLQGFDDLGEIVDAPKYGALNTSTARVAVRSGRSRMARISRACPQATGHSVAISHRSGRPLGRWGSASRSVHVTLMADARAFSEEQYGWTLGDMR